MVIKLFLLSIMVLCIVYIGYEIKACFHYRIVYFNDMCVLCDRLLNNLDFLQNKKSVFFDKNISDLVIEKDIVKIINKEHFDKIYLKKLEQLYIYNFISKLGFNNIVVERNVISHAKSEFGYIHQKCVLEYEKYGILIFKLSIILSMLLFILFI